MLTFSQAWHNAFDRSTVPQVAMVRIYADFKRVLTVNDVSVAMVGDTVTITIAPDDYVLTAGTDFNIGGLDAESIASNIAAAWNTQEDARATKTGIRAFGDYDRVHFSGGSLTGLFSIAVSSAFAAENYGAFPPDTTFYDQGRPGIEYTFLTGDTPLFNFPNCVDKITPSSSKIDPYTRRSSVGAIDVKFMDNGQAIREIAKFHRLYLAPLELYSGTQNLAQLDFELIGTYVVSDIVPEQGSITLQCLDLAERYWSSRYVRGAWVGARPLEAVEDILLRADATATVDLSTLDPSLYTDISHFVVSRYNDELFGCQNSIANDEKVDDAIAGLIAICGGALIPRPTGEYYYRHWDHDRAVDRTWNASPPGSADEGYDIASEGIEVVESVGRIVNHVRVNIAKRGGQDGQDTFALQDEFSRLTFGESVEVLYDLAWDNSMVEQQWNFAEFTQARLQSTSDTFDVAYAGRQGFCGVAYDHDGSAWQLRSGADMGGATGRYCYILISGRGRFEGGAQQFTGHEYIAIDEWLVFGSSTDDEDAGLDGVPGPRDLTAQIATVATPELTALGFGDYAFVGRGGLDSTQPGDATPVLDEDYWRLFPPDTGPVEPTPDVPRYVDVTIAIHVAQRTLRRYRFGAPQIKVRTTLEQLEVELGDFVAINGDDVFVGHQQVGLTSAVVWEVVGKNVDLTADSPGIIWTLVFVRNDEQANQIFGFVPPVLTVEGGAVPVPPVDRRIRVRNPNSPGTYHIVHTNAGDEVWHK